MWACLPVNAWHVELQSFCGKGCTTLHCQRHDHLLRALHCNGLKLHRQHCNVIGSQKTESGEIASSPGSLGRWCLCRRGTEARMSREAHLTDSQIRR